MSRIPGHAHHIKIGVLPARTPGPIGIDDAADPNRASQIGDTPGPLGINDHAAQLISARAYHLVSEAHSRARAADVDVVGLKPRHHIRDYPARVHISSGLLKALESLRDDSNLPDDLLQRLDEARRKGIAGSRMERAMVIDRSGKPCPLPKNEHVRLLSGLASLNNISLDDLDRALRAAMHSSPSEDQIVQALGINPREVEIGVHSHPGKAPPSSVLVPTLRPMGRGAIAYQGDVVSLLRGSVGKMMIINDETMFLLIKTVQTGNVTVEQVAAACSQVSSDWDQQLVTASETARFAFYVLVKGTFELCNPPIGRF